jgi:hypothetical protein
MDRTDAAGCHAVGCDSTSLAAVFPVTRDQLTMLASGNTAGASALEALIGRRPRSFTKENLVYLGGKQ